MVPNSGGTRSSSSHRRASPEKYGSGSNKAPENEGPGRGLDIGRAWPQPMPLIASFHKASPGNAGGTACNRAVEGHRTPGDWAGPSNPDMSHNNRMSTSWFDIIGLLFKIFQQCYFWLAKA